MNKKMNWRKHLCPYCHRDISLTKSEMLIEICKIIGYKPLPYIKGSGNVKYEEMFAIYKYLKDRKKA